MTFGSDQVDPLGLARIGTAEPSGRVGRRAGALAALGWPGVVLGVLAVIAVIGPWIAPKDPVTIDALHTNVPPFHSTSSLLGTDGLGRDMLSRVLEGARLSMMVGVIPVVCATAIGVVLGSLAAFGPIPLSSTLMRLTDVAFAFPSIMLALAVAAILGPSLRNELIALTVVLVPPLTRVTRAAGLEVAHRPYMAAARLSGASKARIAWDFALPNMVAPILVYAAGLCGLIIIFGAGLSFIGVGVQPPDAEWGRMVSEGRNVFLINPWSSLTPGSCIFIASLSFNLAADRLRDYLDPRLR